MSASNGDKRGGNRAGPSCPQECECCQKTWLAALTLAENVLLDEVYDAVHLRSPRDAVRRCALAIRGLREMGRAAWACED